MRIQRLFIGTTTKMYGLNICHVLLVGTSLISDVDGPPLHL